uniref:Uncharacterized protein n=1 Tax=Pristionchus pacificus TaxID=54126 RepID=A0A8R1YUU5_PRIPA
MGGLGPVDWSSFLITVAMAGERVLLPWFPIGLLMELRADRVPLSNTNPGVCWSLLCARVLQTRNSIFEREIRAWILRDQTS